MLGTESNHPTWPFLAAPETPVNTRPSLLKPFSHLHYNGVSTENRMAVFFLFLKSKGREKENTEIFRKQINGPFVFPSRDKRKHHQAAHMEPRTTRSSACGLAGHGASSSTSPDWELSQQGSLGLQNKHKECELKQPSPTALAITEVQSHYSHGDVPDFHKGRELLHRAFFLTSQKSPQSKNSRIEMSFCNFHSFDFLHSLKQDPLVPQ